MAHIVKTAKLGGAASHIVLAKVAHGLMKMTWTQTPISDKEAFEAIKGGIDALPPGVKMFLNSAEYYGPGLSTANLDLLARFFDKYPEYADRTFLSVKGGAVPGKLVADGSRENLRRSVRDILKALRGTKRLDLFIPGRLDPKYTIEEYAPVLNELVEEGKFDYIGLSTVDAETIRRAHKVMSIVAVENEVSLESYDQPTKDVIATCKELGIAITAYSPLGRGLLTDRTKGGIGNFTRLFHRSQDDFVGALSTIAHRKNITLAQLSIAWVGALGDQIHMIPLPGSSNVKRTLENLRAGDVQLSAEDIAEIGQLLEKHKGTR